MPVNKVLTLRKWLVMNGGLAFALIIVILFCLLHGSEEIRLKEVSRILVGMEGADTTKSTIILQVRLPRILLAGLVGGILAVCGTVYQALLRNPLADPFILGVSSGAALGAYLAMLAGFQATVLGFMALPVFAFVGGILAVGLVYVIAKTDGRLPVTGLLLSGVVVNAILSALILFVTSIFDAGRVMTILIWIMGHISSFDYSTVVMLAIYGFIGGGIVFIFSKPLNLFILGEEEAFTLGIPVERVKKILLLVTTFMTGVAVSVSGIIGFVGMIAPHAVRIIIGPDHRLLLPAAALVGASFLIVADTAARTLISPMEIPVGVLTALVGGPFFLLLLKSRKNYGV